MRLVRRRLRLQLLEPVDMTAKALLSMEGRCFSG